MANEDLTRQVKRLSSRTFEAFTRGRLEDIASFAAKDFSFIDARGVQTGLRACLRSLEELISNPSPEGDGLRIDSFKTSDEQERFVANAVVQTLLYSDQVTFRSRLEPAHEASRTFRVTNVWANEVGKVELVSMHITPVHI